MLRLTRKLNFLNKNSLEYAKRTISANRKADNQTSSAVTDAPEEKEQVGAAASGKLPARLPLVKNFFVGLVDKELLAYPETIPRDDMSRLNNELLALKNYFSDDFDYKTISKTYTFPKDMPENFKELGLYGLNVPSDFQGKGWGYSGSLMASEPECNSTEVATGLLGHRAVIDVILELGTDEQKHRFLTKLGNGSFVATEAIYEMDVPDDDLFNTRAQYESESRTWVINGTKAFVISPPKTTDASQIFFVVAQTQRGTIQNVAGEQTTVFLVNSNAAGVKIGERQQTIGCRANTIQYIQLDNVRVTDTSVLGHADNGAVVLDAFLKALRLRNSLVGVGLAKNILQTMTQEAIQKKICGVDLKDLESVQTHLAKNALAIYSMESMIYLTAGLLDEFHMPDVALESAVTKYFTLKELLNISIKSLDLFGPKSMLSGEDVEQYFRNTAQLYTQGESIDNLSAYIAFSGLQHAGSIIGNNIRKQRNPAFNPGHIFSKFLERSNIDEPRTNMDLHEHLHPSLEPSTKLLEHSVARLQMCVDLVLTRYGNSVIDRHNEARRIADMASTIYAMFASLSRSSRSYCIGLPLADHELLAASTITVDGHDKVKILAHEIFNGSYVNNDNNLQRLSRQIIKSKGFFATNPLTYNF